MAQSASFRFLYREESGRLGPEAWRRGVAPLALLVAAATILWLLVRPYGTHDLATAPFIDFTTILVFLYLAIYTFGVILAAVCFYNLSAKRFRDRGRRGVWAAAVPLSAFLAGALAWFAPQSFGTVPPWAATLAFVVVAAILVFTVVDLGFGATRDLP